MGFYPVVYVSYCANTYNKKRNWGRQVQVRFNKFNPCVSFSDEVPRYLT